MNMRCLVVSAVVLPLWLAGFCLPVAACYGAAVLCFIALCALSDVRHVDDTPEKNHAVRKSVRMFNAAAVSAVLLMSSGNVVHASHVLFGALFGYFGLLFLAWSWWIGRNANRYRGGEVSNANAG